MPRPDNILKIWNLTVLVYIVQETLCSEFVMSIFAVLITPRNKNVSLKIINLIEWFLNPKQFQYYTELI
jgi:hypothetical protein